MGNGAHGALAICVLVPGVHLCLPFAAVAEAADWSVNSRLSSTVLVDDNLSRRPDPLGIAIGFLNSATLDIAALMKTGSFNLSSHINHNAYEGPGAPPELGGLTYGSAIALQKSDKLTQYGLTASVAVTPTAQIELVEDEEIRSSGDTISYRAGGTISRELGPGDTVSAAVALSSSSAQDSDRQSRSLSVSGSWNHAVSDNTSLGASFSGSQSISGPDDAETLLWAFTGDISTALSERLSASASAGFSVVDGARAADLVDEVEIEDGPTVVGPTMSLALTYALKTTTLTLIASDAISQTTFGELRESRSFGFTLAHAVNRRANIVLAGLHKTSTGGGLEEGERVSRSVSLVYTHSITPYWNGSLTYRYQDVRRAGEGLARSNAAFFSLSRNLTLIP